jgi:hypothetical protein
MSGAACRGVVIERKNASNNLLGDHLGKKTPVTTDCIL